MVKGIINAFDHKEFCLVINLTMSGNGAVYMATNNCYLVYSFCYHFKYPVASTCYPEKRLISNTDNIIFGKEVESMGGGGGGVY